MCLGSPLLNGSCTVSVVIFRNRVRAERAPGLPHTSVYLLTMMRKNGRNPCSGSPSVWCGSESETLLSPSPSGRQSSVCLSVCVPKLFASLPLSRRHSLRRYFAPTCAATRNKASPIHRSLSTCAVKRPSPAFSTHTCSPHLALQIHPISRHILPAT